MAPATIVTTTTTVTEKIATLAARYDNREDGLAAAAVKADAEGRPAYWRTTRYHNATAALFLGAANTMSLAAALAAWVDSSHPAKTADALLSVMVPLNKAAAAELMLAVSGMFREAA
jgi:hypothetical protein